MFSMERNRRPLIPLFVLGFLLCPFKVDAESQTSYPKALQTFQNHLQSKQREVDQRSGGFRKPGLPFLLTHGHPTRYCVLLFHGLSDSPYFMRDIAESLFQQGYNVVAPLISGNGTKLSDLEKISLSDWRMDETLGMRIASGLGEKVIAGGLSAGGALSVDTARRFPEKVEGLLLFSPALCFQKKTTCLSCWYKGGYVAGKTKDVPIRYQKISNNGVCQLYHLVQELDLAPEKSQYQVPLFAALTEYDDVIKVQWTIDWIEGQNSPDHLILAYAKHPPESELTFPNKDRAIVIPADEICHAQITRKTNEYNNEWNPWFGEMEKALMGFMRKNFYPGKKENKK